MSATHAGIAAPRRWRWRAAGLAALGLSALAVLAALIWAGVAAAGVPDPTDRSLQLSPTAAMVGAGVLVFREGLETILVLAAITASMVGLNAWQRRPVAAGGGVALVASLATWFVVVAILDRVALPEYQLQALTGWLAIVVLLVVMNWFFHKIYWTGWIQTHNRRKRRLLQLPGDAHRQVMLGLASVGFFSIYREGFEVVLFLQNFRLQAGLGAVIAGTVIGLYLTATVGVITFVMHHRLPYKKMLVATGVMLAAVLVVMVGEEINEMQLAGWMGTTALPGGITFPDWLGTWLSLFANWETILAQALTLLIVLGSYALAGRISGRRTRRRDADPAPEPA